MMHKAREWVSWDPNPQTRSEIAALIDQNDEQQLGALLNQRLKFGTAGLRGQMGAGYSRMNDLVVLQTAQVKTRICLFGGCGKWEVFDVCFGVGGDRKRVV